MVRLTTGGRSKDDDSWQENPKTCRQLHSALKHISRIVLYEEYREVRDLIFVDKETRDLHEEALKANTYKEGRRQMEELKRKHAISHVVKCFNNQNSGRQLIKLNTVEGFNQRTFRKIAKKASKTEHHLWNKRDSAASGQKALNLVRIVCGLPNEKEAVYGELDKWTTWELGVPVIAVANALNILKQQKQWKRIIRVFADMEELGVKPDEDTARKVARAFQKVGEKEKQNLVLKKYLSEWKYIHFKGERVRVKRYALNE
ncbi:pentatricopeptide repeat superfamily protein [Tanacetum coccineum]